MLHLLDVTMPALRLDLGDLARQDLDALGRAQDLRPQVTGQRAAVPGPERLQLVPAVPAPRLELGDALGAEQALDAVRVTDPLPDEGLPLAGEPPLVLVLGAGRHDHGADPRL